jgi:hypothetical protein
MARIPIRFTTAGVRYDGYRPPAILCYRYEHGVVGGSFGAMFHDLDLEDLARALAQLTPEQKKILGLGEPSPRESNTAEFYPGDERRLLISHDRRDGDVYLRIDTLPWELFVSTRLPAAMARNVANFISHSDVAARLAELERLGKDLAEAWVHSDTRAWLEPYVKAIADALPKEPG